MPILSSTNSSSSPNKTLRPIHAYFLTALFASFLLRAPGFAVPPPEGFPVPDQPVCRINRPAAAQQAARLKAAPFFQTPLSPTTAYVLVARIDFNDQPMTKTLAQTLTFFDQVKAYYLENSYGLLTVSATVTNAGAGGQGAYRMPQNLAAYAQGICSNFDQVSKDAVAAADADVNFAAGSPAGTRFNHIMIYHAGIGAETSGDAGCQTDNLWSVFAPTVAPTAPQTDGVRHPFAADGILFSGVTIVPESEAQGIDPLGVICHEYGHQLGLPDLYKTPAVSVVGLWSLMDSGVYIGSPRGSNPAHLDAWSKQYIGFSAPQTAAASDAGERVRLEYSVSTANAFVRVPILGVPGVDGSLEYFLIERRAGSAVTGAAFDNALPFGTLNQGFLIWHIDDTIAMNSARLEQNSVNSGVPNYGVDLVEAAGAGAVASTLGKDTDPFPGAAGKSLFAAPHSNSISGLQTGIAVSDFSGSIVTVKRAFASESLDIARVINYPNPGGPSYPQKRGSAAGTVTTIVLHTTRPATEFKLTVHDMTGRLVRTAPPGMIRANGNAIGTGKFVYEFDWDGKNDEGETVPGGVYLYRFKADESVVKTGKLAIVR